MSSRRRPLGRSVVFGSFHLDPERGELTQQGRPIALRRRTWDLLCALVARPGELISKDDLLATVWHDVVVSEQTLATSITEIRRALGDDAARPRFLQTVRRRGYRFIADVK